jgi:hypothetical protein
MPLAGTYVSLKLRGWVYSKNIKVRNADSNFIIQWAI